MSKNHSSTFHGMIFYFIHAEIFSLVSQRLEANDCENTSFFQSETRTIVFHRVNLSVKEIKSNSDDSSETFMACAQNNFTKSNFL